MSAVLDASAILAVLFDEVGRDLVEPILPTALLLTVNLAEIAAKLVDKGIPGAEAMQLLAALDCRIEPLDQDVALLAGLLIARTRRLGLSLGDRCCLAFAVTRNMPVFTADRNWASLDIGAEVHLIR